MSTKPIEAWIDPRFTQRRAEHQHGGQSSTPRAEPPRKRSSACHGCRHSTHYRLSSGSASSDAQIYCAVMHAIVHESGSDEFITQCSSRAEPEEIEAA